MKEKIKRMKFLVFLPYNPAIIFFNRRPKGDDMFNLLGARLWNLHLA